MKKKVVTMQEEKSQVILPPVTPVGKTRTGFGLDDSKKPISNLPEMSGIRQLTNTSITGFNINDISTDNFLQGQDNFMQDQDSLKFDTGKINSRIYALQVSLVVGKPIIYLEYFRCRKYESNTRGKCISSKCDGG